MDLKQLAALCAVADHGSFSAAARALHTVQSNISTHVARLERQLGATLIDRSTGRLTEVGEMVALRARRVQVEVDAIAADVTSITSEVSGTVRLGVIGTTGRWLVPLLLPAMTRAHPRVQVVVIDATTTSLVPQLIQSRLDLAVLNVPLHDPDLEVEPLFSEDRVLVAPEGHPLASLESVTLRELAEHQLLLEPQGTAFRADLDADAERAGATLRPLAEIDGMRLLATLAFEGFGPAVLPATALPKRSPEGWRTVTVEGLSPRAVGLVTRRRIQLSVPARAVRDVLRRVVSQRALAQPGMVVASPPDPA